MPELPFTFLICSERSGSNLITRLFDSHSEFCGPSPSHLIRIMAHNRSRYGDLQLSGHWKIFCADVFGLLQAQLGAWQHTFTEQELVEQVPQQTLGALVRYVYEQEARANNKTRLFVKENHTATFLPFLLSAFPGSKFVYLVRDPRDMALSYKQTLAHTGGVSEAVKVWLHDQNQAISHYWHLHEAGLLHLLTYEALLAEPEKSLTDVCDFLEVKFETQMLAFHQDRLTRQNATRLKAWENLQQPLLRDNFNKFREGLTELEIRFIESKCSQQMMFFGYEPVFEISQNPDELEKQLLAYEKAHPVQVNPPGPEEQEIRQKRQQALQQVLNRQLPNG